MRGVITRTDVLRNLGLIWREFGTLCLCRCLRAALSARKTTFLEIAMKPRRLLQQDQRVAMSSLGAGFWNEGKVLGLCSGCVIALVFGLFVASAVLISCGGGIGVGSGGGSGSGSIISALTASPSQVDYGETTTLSWTLSGMATSLTLDGASVLGESSRRVSPARRQTYELAASNSLGAETRSVTVAARGLDLLAGTLGGAGNLDGIGSAARFNYPGGVAVDGSGNVYVADTFNHTIRRVTAAGVVSTLAGSAGMVGSAEGSGSAARFNYPGGVAVDGAGNVYVADSGNHTIRKVTAAGVVSTLAGSARMVGSAEGSGSAARFNGPGGVAVDGAGNVYVADTNNYTIRKVTAAGAVSTLAGSAGTFGSTDGVGSAARFDSPSSVAVDGAGNVYVADTFNSTIRRVTAARVVSTVAGSAGIVGSADGVGSAARFDYPGGVALDGAGDVYLADSDNHTIRKVTSAGMVSTLAGLAGMAGSADGTGSTARFNNVRSVAVDGSGDVYVADSGNHTIRRVTAAGEASTLAGSAGMAGSADGPALAARFYNPIGVAVDGAGNVYVADTYNHTIRKMTAAGVVSTLAGSAGMAGSADGTGSAARFNNPFGVAVNGSGDVYVADSDNHTIRKVTAAGVVSTLAGSAGMAGSADGPGMAARFNHPNGVAVDDSGDVYVADSENHTIRKIIAGVVSTLAGSAGMAGSADGPGSAARFRRPNSAAADGSGNVYVADTSNHTIRKVTAAGVVTTIAGSAGSRGVVPGLLPATLFSPRGIALTPAGDLIVSSSGGVVQITAF